MDIGGWITQSTPSLAQVSETPGLDVQLLAAEILQKPRSWILAHPEAILEPDHIQKLTLGINRLEAGEPLPYVLGHWEFYGLDFRVAPAVLIPRPETELLVEQAVNWLHSVPGRRWAVDIGTGSGCIAVTLALQVPDLRVIACDRSWEALQVAQENCQRHGVAEQVDLVQANLLEPFGMVDLICANLPYIPSSALASLKVARWEPLLALDGGPDGLSLIRSLLKRAPALLAADGLLLLEIEASLGQETVALVRRAFPHAQITRLTDLSGQDRIIRVINSRRGS